MAKLNRGELFSKLREIIESSSNDPIEELRTLGTALVQIADALKGQDVHTARALIRSVAELYGAGK